MTSEALLDAALCFTRKHERERAAQLSRPDSVLLLLKDRLCAIPLCRLRPAGGGVHSSWLVLAQGRKIAAATEVAAATGVAVVIAAATEAATEVAIVPEEGVATAVAAGVAIAAAIVGGTEITGRATRRRGRACGEIETGAGTVTGATRKGTMAAGTGMGGGSIAIMITAGVKTWTTTGIATGTGG